MRSSLRRFVFLSLCSAILSFNLIGADAPKAAKAIETAAKVDDLLGALKHTGAKVILLNVWSTQCTPCLAEMPTLVRAALKFKNNVDVAFMGLILSGENETQKAALESAAEVVKLKQVTYQNMLWTGKGEALLDRFNIIGTPYIVFISGEGKVLGDIELPEDQEKAGEVIEAGIAKALKAPSAADAAKSSNGF